MSQSIVNDVNNRNYTTVFDEVNEYGAEILHNVNDISMYIIHIFIVLFVLYGMFFIAIIDFLYYYK